MRSSMTFACLALVMILGLKARPSQGEANVGTATAVQVAWMFAFPGESTGEWPALQTGIWQLDSTRIPPSGKAQRWSETVNQCSDARGLLTGYWGLGIVERAGCRQSSSKIEPTRFKVVSECMVRHAGKATSEAIVTITSPDAFELDVR